MKKNMKNWVTTMISSQTKKAFPLLSFPAVQIMNTTVKEMVTVSDIQTRAMKIIAERCPMAAAVAMMDLSVEAEAFGSKVAFETYEMPNVTNIIINNEEDADSLSIPQVGYGRTGVCIEAISDILSIIGDRPVFASAIGPYTLAGRMMGMTQIMENCYEEPATVELVMEKATSFIIKYIEAYKSAGANGVIIAEPAAGLLSPMLMKNMAEPFMKKIVQKVQTDEFIVIYHNCGSTVSKMTDIIADIGASGYHFGNSVNMKEMLEKMPDNVLIMGNIDPTNFFYRGTPDMVAAETNRIMNECCSHGNFIISSGCDIPPMTPWENIDIFFRAVTEFYHV